MPSISRRRALKTLFCSSAALALNLQPRHVAAQIADRALHLLAIGDFGTGAADQIAVAKAMQNFVTERKLKTEGLWLLGDNFYGAVKEGFTVGSKRWQTDIEDMYPASVFPGPCWAVLGNHDYHDNPGGEQVQLAYAASKPGLRWTMPSKWFRFDLGAPAPMVTFICLDSNLQKVSGGKDKKTGKPKAHMSADEEKAQLEWLKAELQKPRAPFTVVVAHHPLYSNGSHGDSSALIEQWGDLLQQHQVHAYLCGHDHDLQHLELEGKFTSFVLSGGGGARTRKLASERRMPYGSDVHGFTHLQIQDDALTFTHHGVSGGVLHTFTKKRDGSVVIA